jgi:hypothetical protein
MHFRLTFQQTIFYTVTDKRSKVPFTPLDKSWKEGLPAVAKVSSVCQKCVPCPQFMQKWHRKIYQISKHQRNDTRLEIMVLLLLLLHPQSW